MKILHLVLTALFLLFAVVQYNDPDGWMWIILYGYMTAVMGFAAFGRRDRTVIVAGIFLSGIWMLTLIPGFIHWIQMGMPAITAHMKAEAPHIELTREFLGLLICLATLVWQYRLARPGKPAAADTP